MQHTNVISKPTVIAIEGIDRIGKSSFISELQKELEKRSANKKILIQKPSIGINTLHKNGYPLSGVSNIMEIRNIGLMEEFMEQCSLRKNEDEIIIRDRFHLSELVYGQYLRIHEFHKTFQFEHNPVELYEKWNSWFEEEIQKHANIHLVCFVLDENSEPNDDECLDAFLLKDINKQYHYHFNNSIIKSKHLIELTMNKDTNETNIMNFVQWVADLLV